MRVRQRRFHIVLATVATAAILGAAAHPEAILRSSVSTVRAGADMPLQGEQFLADQPVKLALRGAFNEYDLPEVRAAADGTFSLELAIPSGVRPGAYRLVAIAEDGDVVASIDVTVEPAATGMEHEELDHGAASAGAGAMREMAMGARADELPIERSRGGMEWGILGLVIGLSAGLGLGLVRTAGGRSDDA